jgi:hypothetical protein
MMISARPGASSRPRGLGIAVLRGRIPGRWRLFVGVALVSVLLHGAVVDLWRGSMNQLGAGGQGHGVLRMHIQGVVPVTTRSAGQQADARGRSAEVNAHPHLASPSIRSARPASGALVEESVAVAVEAPPAGRPMTLIEAQAAWRLSLGAVLKTPEVPLEAPLTLRIGFSSAGLMQTTLVQSTGITETDLVWTRALVQAASIIPLPPVLQGQSVDIEMELWP